MIYCEQCGSKMRPTSLREEMPVLVKYKRFESQLDKPFITQTLLGSQKDEPGHNHDDNCLVCVYVCSVEKQHAKKRVSKRRSCPSCDWKGKTTCFCHDGNKYEDWP